MLIVVEIKENQKAIKHLPIFQEKFKLVKFQWLHSPCRPPWEQSMRQKFTMLFTADITSLRTEFETLAQ